MQILTLVLLGVSLVIALRALYRRAYGFTNRTIVDVIPFLQEVNVEHLAELIDSAEERFLRSNLGEKEFRKAQLKRMRLLREYVNRMSHNTGVLLEWARSDRRKSWDSAFARLGGRLGTVAYWIIASMRSRPPTFSIQRPPTVNSWQSSTSCGWYRLNSAASVRISGVRSSV